MKKTFLVLAAIVLGTVSASAQFEAGKKTLSGSLTGLNFSSTSIKDVDDSQIDFGLGAKGSYFVIDNLAITAGLGLDYSGQGKSSLFGLDFTIGARYNVYNALYAGVSYILAKPLSASNSNGDDVPDDYLKSSGAIKIEVGYDLYLTDNVYFEPALYYSIGQGDGNNVGYSGQFGALQTDVSQFGLSLGIGVNF